MIADWKQRESGVEERLNLVPPMNRAAQASEMAEAAACRLSDRASHAIGAALPVDGRMTS
jgi:hypothetical protein